MYKMTAIVLALPMVAFAQDSMNPQNGMMQTLFFIGLAMALFYLILWRPEQKRRKAADEMRNALKKGDRVTAMGIVGTIASIHEQTIILTMVEGAKIEILKAAITDVRPGAPIVEEGKTPS